MHARIQYRGPEFPDLMESPANGKAAVWKDTTAGRLLFNRALPAGYDYVNKAVRKKEMTAIVDRLAIDFRRADAATSLDAIKSLCFNYAMRSGLTISINDVQTPTNKYDILDRHEAEADKVEKQFRRGIITDGERKQKEVEIWTTATSEVTKAMQKAMESTQFNPIDMMVGSGARGNMMQVRQIAGMRGLVANPRGDMIPRPIKSNFREGLSVLEYFIATPGARKGLVDTALRTADSGYLTRRLVDVAQELIINDRDPFAEGGPVRSITIENMKPDEPGKRFYLETKLFSRTLAEDIKLADGTTLSKGTRGGPGGDGGPARRPGRRDRPGALTADRRERARHLRRRATACRWPPARTSSPARRSASSPPSPSASPVPS